VTDIDALTGLPTYGGLRAALAEPTTAIFLDIDGLRYVNYDHDFHAGDDVLRRVGARLQQEAAAVHGQVFRVAGDEFLLLLPAHTLAEAAAIARKLVGTGGANDGTTLSAVVFRADPRLPDRLRETLDELAEKLYAHEIATGRAHSNVVVDET
jgi:diguanylate cyclase (GGDEF)-like protein